MNEDDRLRVLIAIRNITRMIGDRQRKLSQIRYTLKHPNGAKYSFKMKYCYTTGPRLLREIILLMEIRKDLKSILQSQ